MEALDTLVSVDVDLATAAFQTATFSTILFLYTSTVAAETSPQLVSSPTEMAAVTSLTQDARPTEYNAVSVLFGQNPGPNKIIVCPVTAFSADALNAQLPAINALGGFYGVLSVAALADQQTIATWAQANKKLFVAMDNTGTGGATTTTDLAAYFQTNDMDHCAAICAPSAASYPTYLADFAWMAKAFSYAAGSENWSNMQLTGVLAENLTTEQRANILAKNGNTFEPYGNDGTTPLSLTFKGTVGTGNYIDEIRGRDALCNSIKTAVANVLIQRPKVPYTDGGISAVKGAILATLENYMRIGFLDQPSTNSDGTVNPSYTVTVPQRKDIATSQIQARDLSGITFTARLASAIDTVNGDGSGSYGIVGTLVYSMS